MNDAEKLRAYAEAGGETKFLLEIADLLDAVQEYRAEYESPVPDYTLRRALRERMFSRITAPVKPEEM